jgi:hypothetical protein
MAIHGSNYKLVFVQQLAEWEKSSSFTLAAATCMEKLCWS